MPLPLTANLGNQPGACSSGLHDSLMTAVCFLRNNLYIHTGSLLSRQVVRLLRQRETFSDCLKACLPAWGVLPWPEVSHAEKECRMQSQLWSRPWCLTRGGGEKGDFPGHHLLMSESASEVGPSRLSHPIPQLIIMYLVNRPWPTANHRTPQAHLSFRPVCVTSWSSAARDS